MESVLKRADRAAQSCIKRQPFVAVGGGTALTLILALGIGYGLTFVGKIFETRGLEPWETAAWVHTILSAVLVGYLIATKRFSRFIAVNKVETDAPLWLHRHPLGLLWLTVGFLGMVFLASLVSRSWSGSGSLSLAEGAPFVLQMPPWSFVLWVPWVEETFYRVGVGGIYQRYFPGWLGIWFSSILFSLIHSPMSLGSIMSGSLSLPLGPFFLGILCGSAYQWTQNIWTPVAIHAVCNGTVMIFTWLDPRWLGWLQILYLETHGK